MKRILFLLAAMMITIGANAKSANDTTVSFKISPAMSCINCENKIKTNLRYEKGIVAIEAKAPGEMVNITFNKTKTDASKIAAAFEKIGYKATPKTKTCCTKGNTNNPACGKSVECGKKKCDKDKKECNKKECNKEKCCKEKKSCCKSSMKCTNL